MKTIRKQFKTKWGKYENTDFARKRDYYWYESMTLEEKVECIADLLERICTNK